jgi:hypothetical protein
MNISEFHKYNRLARRGFVDALACPTCGEEYVLRATHDAEPVLQCFVCNSLTQPGLKMYERILAVNTEFYKV